MLSKSLTLTFSLLTLTTLSLGCSGGGGNGGGNEDPYATLAPLCSEIQGGNPKEIFTTAVVPSASVLESLIFGGMDPGTLEPINFELGFRLTGLNVPVTAPVDMYVRSINVTNYQAGWRAGETDYAIVFHACSVENEEGDRVAAVEGDLAHITTLSPDLLALIADADAECNTTVGPEETVETCSIFYPADEDDGLVIAEGTLIGAAGGTGNTAYAPGFDFNLFDTRYPIGYLNPDRLGAEHGPGRGYRYGACTYDYFAEPSRTAYMTKVGQNGDLRVHDDFPCGTLAIDKAGSAAGIWILEEMADVSIEEDWVGVLESVLVLGPHPVFPGAREVISTEILELASWDEGGLLLEFEQQNVGSVNVSFYDMLPGTRFCFDADGFGINAPHHFFMELLEGGAKLEIERVDGLCADTPDEARFFSDASMTFVR